VFSVLLIFEDAMRSIQQNANNTRSLQLVKQKTT